MSFDVECPYCEHGQNINHDDGFGYEENVNHEMQCKECEQSFVFETSIHYYFEAKRADCLNGGEHKLHNVITYPNNLYPNWKKCEICGHETKGETR